MKQLITLFTVKICLLLFSTPTIASGETKLIVPLGSDVESLSTSSMRAIFSMRLTQWPDGSPIVVFVLPDKSPNHRLFTQKVLSMFPHQLRRSWDRIQYSGTGMPPIEVQSSTEMVRRVSSTPGAIGYIEERYLSDDIRALSIQ